MILVDWIKLPVVKPSVQAAARGFWLAGIESTFTYDRLNRFVKLLKKT